MKKLLKKFNDGEYLVKVVEPGFFQLVPKLIWIIFALIFISGISYILFSLNLPSALNYIVLVVSAVLLLWYVRFIMISLSTYLLVSSKKLIYVRRHGLFKKEVLELHYNQFQTITCHFKGFVSSLLRVGKVIIDRGGLKDSIVLEHVRHPQTIQDIIMKLQRDYVWALKFKEFDGMDNRTAVSPISPGGGGYVSARDLMFFLQRILNIEEKKYLTKAEQDNPNSSYESSAPLLMKEPSLDGPVSMLSSELNVDRNVADIKKDDLEPSGNNSVL